MSDEPVTEPATTQTENPIPEPNSVPTSPQEPTPDTSIPPTESMSIEVPPVAIEASQNPESAVPVKDQNPANEPLNQPIETTSNSAKATLDEQITQEPQKIEPNPETNPVSETPQNPPEITPPQSTAQMAGNEPIDLAEEIKIKQRQENLKLANETRQDKKRKKIDEILNLFAERQTVTNDEIEKLLHVSDATATRYLQILENENKIKQVGKTGKGVKYEKI